MNNTQKFLQNLALEKQANELLKASYNVNESEINALLNNKSNKHASGKLKEYKQLLNTCKFKLCVYFDVDKWGRQYTVEEKKQGKHRRFIPSVDKVRNVLNEEQGLNVLIDYCLQNQNKIDAAQIILIDKLEGVEHLVFKFNAKNVGASQFVECEFKTNEYGNTYFNRLLDTPLRTDKIRYYDKN
jgi:hypothetical protein